MQLKEQNVYLIPYLNFEFDHRIIQHANFHSDFVATISTTAPMLLLRQFVPSTHSLPRLWLSMTKKQYTLSNVYYQISINLQLPCHTNDKLKTLRNKTRSKFHKVNAQEIDGSLRAALRVTINQSNRFFHIPSLHIWSHVTPNETIYIIQHVRSGCVAGYKDFWFIW